MSDPKPKPKHELKNRIAAFPFDASRRCEYPEDAPESGVPIPTNTRETPEYRQGRAAHAGGLTEDANPYPCGGFTGATRISWFTGFYDARTNAKLGGAFARNGITFP